MVEKKRREGGVVKEFFDRRQTRRLPEFCYVSRE